MHKCTVTELGNNLRLAHDKAEDLSIKNLIRGHPTIAEKFALMKGCM